MGFSGSLEGKTALTTLERKDTEGKEEVLECPMHAGVARPAQDPAQDVRGGGWWLVGELVRCCACAMLASQG